MFAHKKMPLLSPKQIHGVFEEVGLAPRPSDLESILKRNNLAPQDVIEALSDIVHGGETSQVKLKGAEIALKLNGMLNNNEGVAIPIVNIIIHGSVNEINPICIPRESSHAS